MSQSAKKAGKAAASSTIPKRKDQPDAQDLTFGIELEYVFVFLKNHPDRLKFGDIIPEAWAVRWIEHAFDEDLEAKCKACRATVRFPLDIASDYGVLGIPFRVDYERWHVKRETVKMTPEEKDVLKVSRDEYETYGIEITSRILSAGSDLIVSDMKCSDHDHQIGFQDEIRAVVERLKDRFCSFGGSRARWDYLYPNRSCGVHVHVGQGTKGFSHETVQKILSMNIACERLVDQMQSVDRITGTDYGTRPLDRHHKFDLVRPLIDGNTSQYPLSVGFLANAYKRRQQAESIKPGPGIWSETRYPTTKFKIVPELRGLSTRIDIDAWMGLVHHAETNGELFSLYHSRPRYSVVNIDNVGSAVKNTIEFRQCAGTMDSRIILSWLDFAVKQVQYCRDTTSDRMKRILKVESQLRMPHTEYIALLTLVGCGDETKQHYFQREIGRFQKTLRHEEAKEAQATPRDLFVALAVLNINDERNRLHAPNVHHRITEKLLLGGYGQFAREWIDEFATNSAEQVKRKITLGYISPVNPMEEYIPASFSSEGERSSLSGSERSVLPRLPSPETDSPLPYMHAVLRPDPRGKAITYAGASNPDISPMSRLPSPMVARESRPVATDSRERSHLGPQQHTSFKARYARSRSESRRRSMEAEQSTVESELMSEWGSPPAPLSPGDAMYWDDVE